MLALWDAMIFGLNHKVVGLEFIVFDHKGPDDIAQVILGSLPLPSKNVSLAMWFNSEHARQEIPYTDLPLDSITLYACWDQQNWVIMLPSEY